MGRPKDCRGWPRYPISKTDKKGRAIGKEEMLVEVEERPRAERPPPRLVVGPTHKPITMRTAIIGKKMYCLTKAAVGSTVQAG